jgi:hypothetical protein
MLAQLQRSDEEVAVYDDLVARFGHAPDSQLREQVAIALLNKSITLEEQQHPDEAMVVYDEVVRRLSGASEPRLRALVASALISNALILQLKRTQTGLLLPTTKSFESSDTVIDNLETERPGGRNAAPNRAAWTLGRWIAAGALEQGDVEDELYAAAEVSGLVADDGNRQCWATIRSGLSAGRRRRCSRCTDDSPGRIAS